MGAILLLLTGRTVSLPELTGDGARTLGQPPPSISGQPGHQIRLGDARPLSVRGCAHSVPKANRNASSGMARNMDCSPIWLACARIAARLTST